MRNHREFEFCPPDRSLLGDLRPAQQFVRDPGDQNPAEEWIAPRARQACVADEPVRMNGYRTTSSAGRAARLRVRSSSGTAPPEEARWTSAIGFSWWPSCCCPPSWSPCAAHRTLGSGIAPTVLEARRSTQTCNRRIRRSNNWRPTSGGSSADTRPSDRSADLPMRALRLRAVEGAIADCAIEAGDALGVQSLRSVARSQALDAAALPSPARAGRCGTHAAGSRPARELIRLARQLVARHPGASGEEIDQKVDSPHRMLRVASSGQVPRCVRSGTRQRRTEPSRSSAIRAAQSRLTTRRPSPAPVPAVVRAPGRPTPPAADWRGTS